MSFQKKADTEPARTYTQCDLMTNTTLGKFFDDSYKVGKNCHSITCEGDWVVLTALGGKEHRRVHATLVRAVAWVDPEE